MRGRRVATMAEVELPGDYFGPTSAYTDGRPGVFFLLPIARDEGVDPGARGLHHVCSPPHVFRECADGSLEIRESIGAYGQNLDDGYVWHGYLDEGHEWRTA